MNVLILTPDGVGSTILQRIVTLALHLMKDDVINCHELTNGLAKIDNKIHKDRSIGYNQTLEDIATLLKQSTGSLVSRLAKYHLDIRKDELKSQKEFYKFLKEFNDKILICKRRNVFEYAMSWSIREKSGLLNIYEKKERKLLKTISNVDQKYFLKKCKEYVEYLKWIDENFNNYETVYYEDFALNPDKIIAEHFNSKQVFYDNFKSDLGSIFQLEYLVSNNIIPGIDNEKFYPLLKYKTMMVSLEKQNVLSNVRTPIKNTTLRDKKSIVKNYNECKEIFLDFSRNHNWIDNSIIDYDFWNEKNTHE